MPDSDEGRITLAVIKEDLKHMQTDVSTIMQELKEMRTVQVQTQLAMTAIQQNSVRIASVECEVDNLDTEVEKLKDGLKSLTPVAKVAIWIGAGLGASVMALIWGIITHSVTLTFP